MATIIDSYSETNYSADYYVFGEGKMSGQSFTGNGGFLGKAVLFLKRAGSPVGSVYCEIYAHSGVYGTSSIATGSPLATSSSVDVSTLSTDYALVEFSFTGVNQIELVNGTNYVLIYTSDDTIYNYPNYVLIGMDSSSPSHSGNRCYNTTGTWYAQDNIDVCFYIYEKETTPTVGTKYPLPAFRKS